MPTDARTQPSGDQSIRVSQIDVLGPPIGLVDQALPATACSRADKRMLAKASSVQPRGAQARRYSPSHDAPGADVGDEPNIAEPGQVPDIGDVSYPQLVRTLGDELTFHQALAGIRLAARLPRHRLTSAAHDVHPSEFHLSDGLTPPDIPASEEHRLVHRAHPVRGCSSPLGPV